MSTERKTLYRKQGDFLSRVITLGDIAEENVNDALSIIWEINLEDTKRPIDKREPIQLIINSPGGSCYLGLGLVDCVESSETPVHVTVQGHAMSMALPILCVGKTRLMSKRSTLMYHEISWETSQEKLTVHRQELTEGNRVQKMYDSIITSYTKVPQKKLDEIKEKHKEWYITPTEALKLGFIDQII
jgi:ATP-dependent Clp protease protease subunit